MADGGLLPFGATPTYKEEDEDLTKLDTLTERVKGLEDKQKPNINQPVGNGDESIGTDQDIEPQTFAGFLSGINTLFSEVPFGLAQIVSGTISHAQQAAETNVASTTEGVTKGHDPSLTGFSGLVGKHSQSDKDLQEDYQAAVDEAENEAAIDALGTTTSVQGTPGISVSVPSGLASGPEADFGAGVGTGAGTGTGTGDVSAEGSGGEYSGGEASGGLIKGYQEGSLIQLNPISQKRKEQEGFDPTTEAGQEGRTEEGQVETEEGTLESMIEGLVQLGQIAGKVGIMGAIKGMIEEHQTQQEIGKSVEAGRGEKGDPVDITGHDPSQTGIGGLFGFHDKSDDEIAAEIAAAEAEAEQEAAIEALGATTSVGGTDVGVASGAASGPEVSSMGVDTDTGDDSGHATSGEGLLKHGGQIKGYQEGAMVEEQADTTMDTAGLGPMGLVDDMDGDQVTGVEDDLNMETEEGAYVLNADAVELVGLKDLNQLVKDAIDIAIESDIPLPKTVDPTKKVPIKISNGEYVIPAILVPIIGLENLEKMNKRGLEYREKNREEAPPQEAQQQDVPVEPSEVPSRGVPGEINLAQGGALADQMNQLM